MRENLSNLKIQINDWLLTLQDRNIFQQNCLINNTTPYLL